MVACCYFGADLGNGLDRNGLDRNLNGRDSSILFWLALLYSSSPLYWTNYLSPTPFLLSTLLDKTILRPISLLFGQKYSQSKFPLLFALLGLKILSPTPNLQKKFPVPFSFLKRKNSLFVCTFHTLATGVLTVSTNASFVLGGCGFRGRTSVLKQERILNCTTLKSFLQRDLTLQKIKSHFVCCRGNLEFILNSKIRIKNAENVPFCKHSKQFHLLSEIKIPHSILLQVKFITGESQSNKKIIRLHQQYPLVKEFFSPEWVYLSGHS